MTTRRDFLRGLGVTLAAASLPAFGLTPMVAKAAGGHLKFLFVFNPGGWDTTRVFVPAFGTADMEPDSATATVDGLTFVDNPARPGVRTFFEQHARETLIINGMLVRSIAHEICTEIAMTGGSGGLGADWPTRIAGSAADAYTLPSLVLSGPSFPGDQVGAAARTGVNGQLQSLVDGRALDASDVPVQGPIRPAEGLLARYLLRRARARVDARGGALDEALAQDLVRSMEKTGDLKDLQYAMRFATGPGIADQTQVAIDALAQGVSRCVTLAFAGNQQVLGWDTHANNDPQQSTLAEDLFTGLGQLMNRLAQTPGEVEASLADETLVVVMSEMGRTPLLNGLAGKDHWPYTSAMLIGPGITGGRVVGGLDDLFYGKLVDPASAEVSERGEVLSAESLGATLLTLADIDPAEELPGIEPLLGVIA